MYIANRLYIKEGKRISVKDPAKLSPLKIQDTLDVNKDFRLAIEDSDDESITILDLSELLLDYKHTETSWNAFCDTLTEEIVKGYKVESAWGYTDGKTYPDKHIITYNPLNCIHKFNITYANYKTKTHSMKALVDDLHDLKISFRSEASEPLPTFENCLPIINGLGCFPWVDNNELYALDGAYLSRKKGYPEILLCDFTPLGGAIFEPLVHTNDLKDSHPNRTVVYTKEGVTVRNTKEVEFYTDQDLTQVTPIVVLAGVVYWPDEIRIRGDHHFSLDLEYTTLGYTLAWREFCKNNPTSDTCVCFKSENIIPYLNDRLDNANPISADCFVCYVKSKCYVSREFVPAFRTSLTIYTKLETGILVRENTRTIHTYLREELADRNKFNLVHTTPKLYFSDNLITGQQFIFTENNCMHNTLQPVRDNNFMLLYVGG